MTPLEQITMCYPDEQFLYPTGFENAIIGVEPNTMRLVLSEERILEILVEDGMNLEDALDYYSYNIEHAYIGEKTPIYIQTFLWNQKNSSN